MGVKGLWEVLAPVKTSMDLDELTGQIVAVDLSCWLCQCKSVADLPPTQYLRTLFYRTTHLMRLGVKLVFVMDGTPPKLKLNAMSRRRIRNSPLSPGNRQHFNNSNPVGKAQHIIEYLGLPCLQAHGEAEALCALLSQTGLVDGCITQDGDALLYGARRVYKNFTMDKQDSHVDSYCMSDVEENLELTREDLVTLALLTGCDYDQEGVKHVGPDKAVRLIKHLKSKHDSALNRICGWRECNDLDQDQTAQDRCQVDRHCSRCHHPGTKVSHKSEGCSVCTTRVKCLRDRDGRRPCPCDWHVQERKLKENSLEMTVRERALQYQSFPNKELLKEFLENSEKEVDGPLVWKKPTLSDFMNCAKLLKWGDDQALTKVLPTLVSCDMKARDDHSHRMGNRTNLLQPKCIVKVRRKDFKPCYEVQWNKLAEDVWSPADTLFYTTIMEQHEFTFAFRDMVTAFERETEQGKSPVKTSRKGQKRNLSEENGKAASQTTLTQFFGIKKRSTVLETRKKHEINTTGPIVID